ncbi:MAG: phospho-N-acetylmuramoyl-pentapeptide-transferase, partial [Gemmatimonadetes bacterium]|nr:phospho-N-acetylmuramoyl-pentapeptide-transferase [Gemmatimonadota bacterium]
MLYHLLPRLEDVHIVFNLFNYLTVRSAGAMATSLILILILGRRFIAFMHARGIVNVPRNGLDRGQGPKVNMGGVLIVAVVAVSTLLWAELTNPYTIIALVVMLWMGSIGFLDDYLKVVRKTPRGLVERYKWAGSLGLGLALGAFLISWGPIA